jgi:hypothetical protein
MTVAASSSRRTLVRTNNQSCGNTALTFLSTYCLPSSSVLKATWLIGAVATVGYFVLRMDSTVTQSTATSGLSGHVTLKKSAPHTGSSFGGIHNVAQPAGAKAIMEQNDADYEQLYASIVVPKSNVGHAIPSLNKANIINHWGHYVHDEWRSPYASHLYDRPQQELEEEQLRFEQKMRSVRETWGAWDFHDPQNQDNDRPVADVDGVDYKDLPAADFPPYSWQADPDYLRAFWREGRALLDRMTEGIYAEYGYPKRRADGTTLTDEELSARAEAFRIHIVDDVNGGPTKGLAQLTGTAWDGLVRKLLHAMVTNDDFYVVLAGHSAAAGHGNDFQQNRVLTFHRIMEPVFDKLGMRLMSRNMGMGGVGTLQFSLGGGDFYGETDILEWDSGMTEKGPAVDRT